MHRYGLVLLVAGALLAAAGCSGGDDEEPQATPMTTAAATTARGTTTTTDQPSPTTVAPPIGEASPAPGPGRTLLRFVRAAGRGDADGMWALLGEPTQASIGPTLDDFRTGSAEDLRRGLGTLAPTARVILSQRVGERWGAAAVIGERKVGGRTEEFAYGAALAPQGAGWRLELGGVVLTRLKPEPLAVVGRSPAVGVNVGAAGDLNELLMWLDGDALGVDRGGATPFTATLNGRLPGPLQPGRHAVVAFAATTDTATATAWTFRVRG